MGDGGLGDGGGVGDGGGEGGFGVGGGVGGGGSPQEMLLPLTIKPNPVATTLKSRSGWMILAKSSASLSISQSRPVWAADAAVAASNAATKAIAFDCQ